MLAELLHGHAVLLHHGLQDIHQSSYTHHAKDGGASSAGTSLRSERISTHLADEGKGLAPHPLGTVAEPDGELVDEVQTQVISATRVQLLEDLHHLRTCGKAPSLEGGINVGILQICNRIYAEDTGYLILETLEAIFTCESKRLRFINFTIQLVRRLKTTSLERPTRLNLSIYYTGMSFHSPGQSRVACCASSEVI